MFHSKKTISLLMLMTSFACGDVLTVKEIEGMMEKYLESNKYLKFIEKGNNYELIYQQPFQILTVDPIKDDLDIRDNYSISTSEKLTEVWTHQHSNKYTTLMTTPKASIAFKTKDMTKKANFENVKKTGWFDGDIKQYQTSITSNLVQLRLAVPFLQYLYEGQNEEVKLSLSEEKVGRANLNLQYKNQAGNGKLFLDQESFSSNKKDSSHEKNSIHMIYTSSKSHAELQMNELELVQLMEVIFLKKNSEMSFLEPLLSLWKQASFTWEASDINVKFREDSPIKDGKALKEESIHGQLERSGEFPSFDVKASKAHMFVSVERLILDNILRAKVELFDFKVFGPTIDNFGIALIMEKLFPTMVLLDIQGTKINYPAFIKLLGSNGQEILSKRVPEEKEDKKDPEVKVSIQDIVNLLVKNNPQLHIDTLRLLHNELYEISLKGLLSFDKTVRPTGSLTIELSGLKAILAELKKDPTTVQFVPMFVFLAAYAKNEKGQHRWKIDFQNDSIKVNESVFPLTFKGPLLN